MQSSCRAPRRPIAIRCSRSAACALGWMPRDARPSSYKTTSPMLLVIGKDRKSTRLNSSHSQISYAVFCLKKKRQNTTASNCLYLLIHVQHDSALPFDPPLTNATQNDAIDNDSDPARSSLHRGAQTDVPAG